MNPGTIALGLCLLAAVTLSLLLLLVAKKLKKSKEKKYAVKRVSGASKSFKRARPSVRSKLDEKPDMDHLYWS